MRYHGGHPLHDKGGVAREGWRVLRAVQPQQYTRLGGSKEGVDQGGGQNREAMAMIEGAPGAGAIRTEATSVQHNTPTGRAARL